MNLHEEKLSQFQVKATNSSGTTYVQDQLALEQGYFGNVVDDNPDGIIDGASFTLDINPNRTIRTDQIKTADTFAISADENPSIVYFNNTTRLLEDTSSDANVSVGTLVIGGAKDASDFIQYKPKEVYPLSISSNELAEDTIQSINVDITVAEIKALRATPKEIVPAPGANKLIHFIGAEILLTAGTEVLTESADNLAIEFDSGSAAACSETIETTGFIDAAADTITNVIPVKDVIDASADILNKNIALANTGDGEIAGNASDDAALTVKVSYRIVDFS